MSSQGGFNRTRSVTRAFPTRSVGTRPIRLVFDTTAYVANSYYDYDVYGKLRRSTENVQTRYRFTGQELDLMSGLYNFRARQYDGDAGIFYAADPANSSFSPYGYVSGNPVSRVDPTGMVDYCDV